MIAERPHGLSYLVTLRGQDGTTLVGRDNAHVVRERRGPGTRRRGERVHRHRMRTSRPYECKDASTLFEERNAYADYRIVWLEDSGRMLDVSGQAASLHDAEGKGWDYAERLERTLCEAGEMRAYLHRDPGGWPAIIVDTYSNRRTLPQHLLMVEFYRLARSRLLDGGSPYVNFLAWPEDALFRTRAECTLRSVFAGCSAWPVAIEQGRGWVPSRSSIWTVRSTRAKAWIRGCTGSLAAAKAGRRILDGRPAGKAAGGAW